MKTKKILSLFCTSAMLFSIAASPVGQASAYTVDAQESEVPEMPAEVAARYAEHRNHVYDFKKWINTDEVFYDHALIMPGDTFEIPVYETDGGTIYFIGSMNGDGSGNITNDPFFYIDVEGDDNWSTLPSDIYLPDGFKVTGAVEPVAERTYERSFYSSSLKKSFSVTFCEQWVNNTNCPFYLINKGGGSGPLGDKNNQAHVLPQIMFYAPYYDIEYPNEEDEKYSRAAYLSTYFWPQNDFDELEFPEYYWMTDTPYTITFPNPVKPGNHFSYWASNEAEQTISGQYTDLTVCYSLGKDSHGNTYPSSTFKGHGNAKVVPVFDLGTTITFKGCGGTINDRDEWIIEVPEYNGETDSCGYSLEDYVPVKDGDTFLGWCEKETARYDSFVSKDDEAAVYEKFWSTEYDRSYKNTNVTLYAKWASSTKEDLEKNGWEIDDEGTLWLLNNKGVEAWNAAKADDPTLAPKVKGIKQSFNTDDPTNDFAYSLEGVFEGCVNLENLVFENNVRWLSWSAFKDCSKLKTITFMDEIYNNLDNVMSEAPKDVVVTVPETYTGRLGSCTYLSKDETRYGLTVNGELITESNLTVQCGEGTASFDPETSTLTLENAELTQTLNPHWLSIYSDPETYTRYYDAAIVSDLPKLNIVLKGKNVIAKGNLEAFRTYGDLNITGDGTIEAYYTLSNYFIIDNETGEQVPVSGTYALNMTVLGDLTIDGLTVQRLNTAPQGNFILKNSTLKGGIITPNGNTVITDSTLKGFTGGVMGLGDSGKDYTPTIGGKNITVENTAFDYVTVTASEDCENITFKDSKIQLSGKFTAGENTKLNIINTEFMAYGQSDGVTNIPEENITLTDCEIFQGSWTERGYFSIMRSSDIHRDDEVSYSTSVLDNNWYKSSGKDFTAAVYRDPADGSDFSSMLEEIVVDEDTIDAKNYSISMNDSASVNVVLDSEFLETLAEGKHTVYAVFADGKAEYSVVVNKPAVSPDTDTDEPIAPDTDTDEPITPDTDTDEPITPDIDTDEPITPDSDTDEPITPDTDTDEPITPDTDTDEPITPDTDTDEPITPDTDTDEPITPDTDTDEPITPDTDNNVTSDDITFKLLPDNTAEVTGYEGDDNEVTVPSSINGVKVIKISTDAFKNCTSLEILIVSDNIIEIDENAVVNCENLKEIFVPDSVTSISAAAFADCGAFRLFASKGSYCESYASQNNIEFINTDSLYGDMDDDEKITSADSLLILRQSVSLEHFTDSQKFYADVDGDGSITSADSLEVLRASVGLSAAGSIGKKYKSIKGQDL